MQHAPQAGPPAPGRPRLPRRDRIVILLALGSATALAWAYLVILATRMGGMEGMAVRGGAAMAIRPWSSSDFALMFLMWVVMMVGMMLPSAAPITLIHAAVVRKASRAGARVAPTAGFVMGYLAAWTLFSAAATLAQWALDRAALLSPAMAASGPGLGALTLLAAGVYQLTPAKQACLNHCRAPAHFIAAHWRPGALGALRMGAIHGTYCLGCCWALMALLFVGGVMNLLWIAAITFFVLAEKLLPFGRAAARWSGGAMIAVGGLLAARWLPTALAH